MKNQKIRSMKVHEQSGYNYKAKVIFRFGNIGEGSSAEGKV